MRVVVVAAVVALAGLAAGHTYFSPLDFLHYERATVRLDDSISLKVNTTLLEKSGDWVTVSWENVEDPSTSDWIGVYSPPVNGSIDPNHHAPIKYQYAMVSPTHMSEGKGSLNFRLVNMRDEIIMGFFRHGFSDPVLAAVSSIIQFKNPNEPLQGHLAYNGDPTQMILVWVTRNASKPQVKWGTKSGQYSYSKQANSSTYSAKDMCGNPATFFGYRDPGLINQVTMESLIPGTQYYYIFGDVYGWSKEFSFRAAPKPGPDVTTRVVAYGDMGNGQIDDSKQKIEAQQPALNTTRLVTNQVDQTDVLLHIGDISYARGYASVWDEFFDEIEPIAARVPYMVCIGNHERDYPLSKSYYQGADSGGECGVPYERRFPMPRPSLDEAWYGFDYGSAHFVLMSTEHNFTMNSPQFNFLDAHMKTVDRSITPWVIFAGHRPMYIDSTNDDPPAGDLPVAQLLRDNVEPLLKKYQVDLALWGHHHSYQRTCPVYQEVCTEGATTHIVIGMGGQSLSTNVKSVAPTWIEVLDYKHWGYSRFSINRTALVFEYVRDDDGSVHDAVVLKKQ